MCRRYRLRQLSIHHQPITQINSTNPHSSNKQLTPKPTHSDLLKWNKAITSHMRNSHCQFALHLFNSMPLRDTISYNAMISGYLSNAHFDLAKELFDKMPQRDLFSWNLMLRGYVRNNDLTAACALFDRMPERDVVSWTTLLSGYAQNGFIIEAREAFDKMPFKDVMSWTALLCGYVQNGMADEARSIFDSMPEKNSVSWNAMITGYVKSKRMDIAKELFEIMPVKDVCSWTTMITGYSQIGDVAHARSLFDRMPQRNSISWAAMISGYVQNGFIEEAMHLFMGMKRDGQRFNKSSFACALTACANIAALDLGRQLHVWTIKAGFQTELYVGTALLTMYCKCGSIDEAHEVFQEISDKCLISWNAMIHGYARNGFAKEALLVFESMKPMGLKPDDATMVGVFSACVHAGLVEKGIQYFYSMKQEYGITTNLQHYNCMVDLLGRAGQLEEAQNLIRSMHFKPNAATWGALLGASRIHSNAEIGVKAAEALFKMDPYDSRHYVLLSKLYAAAGRWRDIHNIRLKMRSRGQKNILGCSWLEVQNKMHIFTAGHCFHPEKDKIYAFLGEMYLIMKQEGYSSLTRLVFHDVEEE